MHVSLSCFYFLCQSHVDVGGGSVVKNWSSTEEARDDPKKGTTEPQHALAMHSLSSWCSHTVPLQVASSTSFIELVHRQGFCEPPCIGADATSNSDWC